MNEVWAIVMFAVVIGALMIGYPVAFTLGGTALLFGGVLLGLDFFNLLPLRIWGVMTNFTLLAVPLFIFMGVILEKSGLAEELLETMGSLCGGLRGGLAFSVVIVGAMLAATTGVVGATVVTMGVIALPAMLKHDYDASLAAGTIAASGTLGQVIPPSIVLILLADVVGVPIGRLFMAAILPGMVLILLYIAYIGWRTWTAPHLAPPVTATGVAGLFPRVIKSLIPPLVLILAVLGSIFFGIASPTESAALGGLGALLLASAHRRLNRGNLYQAARQTMMLTSMVFLILVGATAFGLVFRGLGGDHLVQAFFSTAPGGKVTFLFLSMATIFVLGFFLDFVEICFIVVPILAPIASLMGVDLLWFALLIAVNLQTSFLTPPFGFSLFYLKAVAPDGVDITHIYRGIMPFVMIQIAAVAVIAAFPGLASWLPDVMDRWQGLG